MDSLHIMNGYNKNGDVFKRNNRVTELRVTSFAAHSKTVKTVRLSDKMGWHEVALPRQAITKLRIELVGFAPSPDNDVCLSEIALFNGPRKIEMHMPQVVVYSDGDGDQYLPPDLLINRKGETIAEALQEETYWSPLGRLVMGRNPVGTLWVADVQKGVVVLETPDSWETAHWRNDQVIEVGSKLGGKQLLRVPGSKKQNPKQ